MGQVFKIAKSIRGTDKESMKANAIKDPNNGNLIMNQDDFGKVSVNFCKKVLEKNVVPKGYERLASIKEKLHDKRMEQGKKKGVMVDKAVYDSVVNKFKRNNKKEL